MRRAPTPTPDRPADRHRWGLGQPSTAGPGPRASGRCRCRRWSYSCWTRARTNCLQYLWADPARTPNSAKGPGSMTRFHLRLDRMEAVMTRAPEMACWRRMGMEMPIRWGSGSAMLPALCRVSEDREVQRRGRALVRAREDDGIETSLSAFLFSVAPRGDCVIKD